ncbi:hypothetical protein EV424DRAFT_1538223 [Suillus variegatus]|nr:hypothetical protein EV424DRAFT_1538223 [Suillus variegatus]
MEEASRGQPITCVSNVHRYAEGGGQSIKLQRLPPNDPRNMMFTSSDSASVLSTWQENLQNAEGECKAAQDEATQLRQQFQALAREINGMNEAEAEKASIMQQFEDAVGRRTTIDQEQATLLVELNKIKGQIHNFEEAHQGVQKKIEDAATSRLEAQSNKNHYTKKLEDETKKVEAIDAIAKQLQEEFINWISSAEEYCERVENPCKVDVVERTLESVQKALKEWERRHGATVEEMTIEVNNAKAVLDSVEKELRSLAVLNNALKRSLVVFQYHLSNRGYFGKILFDHANQTLQLKVQTDDQMAMQGRDKDPQSLSDEFNVFMDAVNCRISMKMMINAANASDKKQYILIMPQDMGNIHVGQTVRVHQMSDPERGQGILAFT